MRLFWIGNAFFGASLSACGWDEVCTFNFGDLRIFGWRDLVAEAGFEPDVLVVADKSTSPYVLGMEDFPCLTVFYAIDSHLHSWYPLYAQGFDACLVSLRDHLPNFAGEFLRPEHIFWTPPYAADNAHSLAASPEKEWDCLFVGTVDATPGRASFLRALKERFPGLHYTRGSYRQLFPKGRILLNICDHGDMNFRIFEALGMGGCLLTPAIGHGLADLFTDGEHLSLYRADDADDALHKINALLGDPAKCERLARAGLALVDAKHRAKHRAAQFTARMQPLLDNARAIVAARRTKAKAIREHCLKLPYLLWAQEMPSDALKQKYCAAASGQLTTI